MDESKLIWGLLFGAVGIGYLIYGRRQRILLPFVAGIGLIGLPYLVDDIAILVLGGVVLLALPFVVKL